MANISSRGPKLPPGRDRHHIVVLEAIHAPMPDFPFPHTITLHQRTQPHEVEERIKDADIVMACVTPVLPSMLCTATRLGCLCVMAVGIAWVDRAAFAEMGVTVTNCPAGNVEAVGEHVLGLYLGLRKRIGEVSQVVKGGREWMESGTLKGLWGLDVEGNGVVPRGVGQEVVGVVGYGNLGRRVKRNFEVLGCKEVLVAERKGVGKAGAREGRTGFEEVMARASVVVVCAPKSEETIDMISEAELRGMQRDALVINVARGEIVNEAALARALKEGWIGGAAVDVMVDEPRGVGMSPLLPDMSKGEQEVPNLIVTPHLAWFTQGTIQNYQRMLREGATRWVEGTMVDGRGKISEVAVVHDGKVWRS